jgi:hypothetical protein
MLVHRLTILLSASGRAARVALGMAWFVAAVGGVALAGPGPGGVGGAPEIDAGSAMSALTLLSGGILLITDRIRRRKSSR